MQPDSHPVLLFDGVCNLCNGTVQFIIRRDPGATVRFAALQSNAAQRLIAATGADANDLPDSMVLIEDGRLFTRSSAMVRLLRHLRFPWPALAAIWLVPLPLRNWVYDMIARRRYRWFGRRDTCMMPTVELQERFL
jgi:predicted DCC family thiol-disulfide oxidoreductase YuxK